MRFEIGVGGGLLIGAGLLGLSGAVFCLGLIGGYEIASQEQHSREVAAVYPLPGPPPVQPAPAESTGVSPETLTSRALASSSPTPGASELGAMVRHPGLPAVQASPTPGAKRIATAAPSSAALSAASGSRAGVAGVPPATPARRPTHPERKLAAREAPAGASDRPRSHQPYSVQIDAVMDRQGAENIARKLSAGGYEPYIVPTEIGGQTWYKVRVGHYDTEAEAHEAEQRLRTEYEGALPTH